MMFNFIGVSIMGRMYRYRNRIKRKNRSLSSRLTQSQKQLLSHQNKDLNHKWLKQKPNLLT